MSLKSVPARKIILAAGVLVIAGVFLARRTIVPSDEVLVERRLRALAEALETNDADTILESLTDDFTIEDERGQGIAASYLRGYLRDYLRYYSVRSIRFLTIKIQVRGDRATALYQTTARWSAPASGSGTHRGEWESQFVRQEDTWKLRHFKVLGEGLYF